MVRSVVRSVRSVRTVVWKLLKSFVRSVVRFVDEACQKIRTVAWKSLKSHKRKIRSVFLRSPPIPPSRARAKEFAPHAERVGEVA